MAMLAPDWVMRAGLADERPALSLSGNFLAINVAFPILDGYRRLGTIQFGVTDLVAVGAFIVFRISGGRRHSRAGGANRRTGAPRCGLPGPLGLPELPRM